jgi:hypothetical protein
VDRFKAAIAYFDEYRQRGGKDDRVDQYIKDANKGIEKEQRRAERERKEQLKKAGKASPDSTVKDQEQSPNATGAVSQAAAKSSAAGETPSATTGSKSSPKSGARKKRTVVSPNTPASNSGADDAAAPAPRPATSGKLGD